MRVLLVLCAVLLAGCSGKPENITPVQDFDSARYLGKWYEIARMDHSFERGLTDVTAEYSMREDGNIRVLNRGYDPAKKEWRDAEGKAKFVESPNVGYLKVSFFGPFYGSYVVYDLDRENYSYSLISGPNKDYMWLLSRTPTMDPAMKKRMLDKAQALGFDASKLIHVTHAAR